MLAQRNEVLARRPFGSVFPFESFFGVESPLTMGGSEHVHMEWKETEEAFVLRAELPGVPDNEIDVQIQDDRVVVKVIANPNESESAPSGHRYTGLNRAFRFRTPLRSSEANATLERGILTIHIPKAASAVPRSLPVKPL